MPSLVAARDQESVEQMMCKPTFGPLRTAGTRLWRRPSSPRHLRVLSEAQSAVKLIIKQVTESLAETTSEVQTTRV